MSEIYSNKEVNNRRDKKESVYGKNVHDYVPFYFNPRNAMMYRNKHEDIVILGFDLRLMSEDHVIFTDRNASATYSKFYKGIENLKCLNWDYIHKSSWHTLPDGDKIKQVMMAEVLVYEHVSMNFLMVLYVKNERMKHHLMHIYNLPQEKIKISPDLFFG